MFCMNGDTKSWLYKAKGDMQSAELLLMGNLYDTACYHTQQAAEKFLKSILCSLDLDIVKTHNLLTVVDLLQQNSVLVEPTVLSACHAINSYSAIVRYPGYDATKEDAEEAVKEAKIIELFVWGYFK